MFPLRSSDLGADEDCHRSFGCEAIRTSSYVRLPTGSVANLFPRDFALGTWKLLEGPVDHIVEPVPVALISTSGDRSPLTVISRAPPAASRVPSPSAGCAPREAKTGSPLSARDMQKPMQSVPSTSARGPRPRATARTPAASVATTNAKPRGLASVVAVGLRRTAARPARFAGATTIATSAPAGTGAARPGRTGRAAIPRRAPDGPAVNGRRALSHLRSPVLAPSAAHQGLPAASVHGDRRHHGRAMRYAQEATPRWRDVWSSPGDEPTPGPRRFSR